MRHAVDLDRLVCASAFEELRGRSPSRVAAVAIGAGKPVEIAELAPVLYVPRLCLQIWREGIVPREANPGCGDPVEEALQRLREGEARTVSGPWREIAEPACILANLYSPNFFHFSEELFKAIILEKARFAGHYVISDRPAFMREFLNLLGIDNQRILVCIEPTLFRSTYLTTPIVPQDPLVYPGVFLALREALREAARGPALGSRLWVERRQSRVVANSEEVREVLDRHGFTVVDMAALGVREQIAAVKQAELFAGPHGAGFLHALFLPERSAVIECFSPEHVNPSIVEICRLLRHRYFQSVPTHTSFLPYEHGLDVKIACNHLELILQNLHEPAAF